MNNNFFSTVYAPFKVSERLPFLCCNIYFWDELQQAISVGSGDSNQFSEAEIQADKIIFALAEARNMQNRKTKKKSFSNFLKEL